MADVWVKVLTPADSYALLTLDEIKAILNLPLTDTAEDAQLQMWIDQYSDVIATMCNRVFAYEAVEENLGGGRRRLIRRLSFDALPGSRAPPRT